MAKEIDVRKKREGLTYHSGGGLDLGMFDHVVDSVANSSDEDYTNWGCWGGGGGIYVKGIFSGTMFYILKSDYLTFMDYSLTSLEYI